MNIRSVSLSILNERKEDSFSDLHRLSLRREGEVSYLCLLRFSRHHPYHLRLQKFSFIFFFVFSCFCFIVVTSIFYPFLVFFLYKMFMIEYFSISTMKGVFIKSYCYILSFFFKYFVLFFFSSFLIPTSYILYK